MKWPTSASASTSPTTSSTRTRRSDPAISTCPLGFVVVGSTHCGDVFALDGRSPPGPDGTPRVILISHEHGWTDADQVLARAIEIAPSYIDFLTAAANETIGH